MVAARWPIVTCKLSRLPASRPSRSVQRSTDSPVAAWSCRTTASTNLAVAASGSVTFSTTVASGAPYDVTIKTQPSNPVQNCTLKNGTARGTVNAADVTTIEVVCANVGRFVYAANLGDLSISAFAI